MKTIGIAACSAEGAALCYRTIVHETEMRLGRYQHPPIVMHSPPFSDFMHAIDHDDWRAVGEIMLDSSARLHAAGADFVICPDNTVHQALGFFRDRSPLPWLHIAEAVAAEAQQRGFRRVAITGTSWLVQSDVYPTACEVRKIEWMRPSAEDRDLIGRIIMDELVAGIFRTESTAKLQAIIQRMQQQGCDAVVLGCTELPIVLNDANSALPTLDSTRLLARAAISHALDQNA